MGASHYNPINFDLGSDTAITGTGDHSGKRSKRRSTSAAHNEDSSPSPPPVLTRQDDVHDELNHHTTSPSPSNNVKSTSNEQKSPSKRPSSSSAKHRSPTNGSSGGNNTTKSRAKPKNASESAAEASDARNHQDNDVVKKEESDDESDNEDTGNRSRSTSPNKRTGSSAGHPRKRQSQFDTLFDSLSVYFAADTPRRKAAPGQFADVIRYGADFPTYSTLKASLSYAASNSSSPPKLSSPSAAVADSSSSEIPLLTAAAAASKSQTTPSKAAAPPVLPMITEPPAAVPTCSSSTSSGAAVSKLSIIENDKDDDQKKATTVTSLKHREKRPHKPNPPHTPPSPTSYSSKAPSSAWSSTTTSSQQPPKKKTKKKMKAVNDVVDGGETVKVDGHQREDEDEIVKTESSTGAEEEDESERGPGPGSQKDAAIKKRLTTSAAASNCKAKNTKNSNNKAAAKKKDATKELAEKKEQKKDEKVMVETIKKSGGASKDNSNKGGGDNNDAVNDGCGDETADVSVEFTVSMRASRSTTAASSSAAGSSSAESIKDKPASTPPSTSSSATAADRKKKSDDNKSSSASPAKRPKNLQIEPMKALVLPSATGSRSELVDDALVTSSDNNLCEDTTSVTGGIMKKDRSKKQRGSKSVKKSVVIQEGTNSCDNDKQDGQKPLSPSSLSLIPALASTSSHSFSSSTALVFPSASSSSPSKASPIKLNGIPEITDADRKRFKEAQKVALESIDSLLDPSQHRCPGAIQIGCMEIETWYSAPYPQEYARLPKLYICEYCLKYVKSMEVLKKHILKCKIRHPPGNEIYRWDGLSVFEVDGNISRIYCQNLCLLAKLFLDHKTLYYDVEPFLFYVLTRNDEFGSHFIGYFSKEKYSAQRFNLSCIVTLPCYQGKGYGRFLIDFSFLLSKKENVPGTPERPLSELGKLSYHSYWRGAILEYLHEHQHEEKYVCCLFTAQHIDVLLNMYRASMPLRAIARKMKTTGISRGTGMSPHDIVDTLQALKILQRKDGRFILQINWTVVDGHWTKAKAAKGRVWMRPTALRWSPTVYSPPSKDLSSPMSSPRSNNRGSTPIAAGAGSPLSPLSAANNGNKTPTPSGPDAPQLLSPHQLRSPLVAAAARDLFKIQKRKERKEKAEAEAAAATSRKGKSSTESSNSRKRPATSSKTGGEEDVEEEEEDEEMEEEKAEDSTGGRRNKKRSVVNAAGREKRRATVNVCYTETSDSEEERQRDKLHRSSFMMLSNSHRQDLVTYDRRSRRNLRSGEESNNDMDTDGRTKAATTQRTTTISTTAEENESDDEDDEKEEGEKENQKNSPSHRNNNRRGGRRDGDGGGAGNGNDLNEDEESDDGSEEMGGSGSGGGGGTYMNTRSSGGGAGGNQRRRRPLTDDQDSEKGKSKTTKKTENGSSSGPRRISKKCRNLKTHRRNAHRFGPSRSLSRRHRSQNARNQGTYSSSSENDSDSASSSSSTSSSFNKNIKNDENGDPSKKITPAKNLHRRHNHRSNNIHRQQSSSGGSSRHHRREFQAKLKPNKPAAYSSSSSSSSDSTSSPENDGDKSQKAKTKSSSNKRSKMNDEHQKQNHQKHHRRFSPATILPFIHHRGASASKNSHRLSNPQRPHPPRKRRVRKKHPDAASILKTDKPSSFPPIENVSPELETKSTESKESASIHHHDSTSSLSNKTDQRKSSSKENLTYDFSSNREDQSVAGLERSNVNQTATEKKNRSTTRLPWNQSGKPTSSLAAFSRKFQKSDINRTMDTKKESSSMINSKTSTKTDKDEALTFEDDASELVDDEQAASESKASKFFRRNTFESNKSDCNKTEISSRNYAAGKAIAKSQTPPTISEASGKRWQSGPFSTKSSKGNDQQKNSSTTITANERRTSNSPSILAVADPSWNLSESVGNPPSPSSETATLSMLRRDDNDSEGDTSFKDQTTTGNPLDKSFEGRSSAMEIPPSPPPPSLIPSSPGQLSSCPAPSATAESETKDQDKLMIAEDDEEVPQLLPTVRTDEKMSEDTLGANDSKKKEITKDKDDAEKCSARKEQTDNHIVLKDNIDDQEGIDKDEKSKEKEKASENKDPTQESPLPADESPADSEESTTANEASDEDEGASRWSSDNAASNEEGPPLLQPAEAGGEQPPTVESDENSRGGLKIGEENRIGGGDGATGESQIGKDGEGVAGGAGCGGIVTGRRRHTLPGSLSLGGAEGDGGAKDEDDASSPPPLSPQLGEMEPTKNDCENGEDSALGILGKERTPERAESKKKVEDTNPLVNVGGDISDSEFNDSSIFVADLEKPPRAPRPAELLAGPDDLDASQDASQMFLMAGNKDDLNKAKKSTKLTIPENLENVLPPSLSPSLLDDPRTCATVAASTSATIPDISTETSSMLEQQQQQPQQPQQQHHSLPLESHHPSPTSQHQQQQLPPAGGGGSNSNHIGVTGMTTNQQPMSNNSGPMSNTNMTSVSDQQSPSLMNPSSHQSGIVYASSGQPASCGGGGGVMLPNMSPVGSTAGGMNGPGSVGAQNVATNNNNSGPNSVTAPGGMMNRSFENYDTQSQQHTTAGVVVPSCMESPPQSAGSSGGHRHSVGDCVVGPVTNQQQQQQQFSSPCSGPNSVGAAPSASFINNNITAPAAATMAVVELSPAQLQQPGSVGSVVGLNPGSVGSGSVVPPPTSAVIMPSSSSFNSPPSSGERRNSQPTSDLRLAQTASATPTLSTPTLSGNSNNTITNNTNTNILGSGNGTSSSAGGAARTQKLSHLTSGSSKSGNSKNSSSTASNHQTRHHHRSSKHRHHNHQSSSSGNNNSGTGGGSSNNSNVTNNTNNILPAAAASGATPAGFGFGSGGYASPYGMMPNMTMDFQQKLQQAATGSAASISYQYASPHPIGKSVYGSSTNMSGAGGAGQSGHHTNPNGATTFGMPPTHPSQTFPTISTNPYHAAAAAQYGYGTTPGANKSGSSSVMHNSGSQSSTSSAGGGSSMDPTMFGYYGNNVQPFFPTYPGAPHGMLSGSAGSSAGMGFGTGHHPGGHHGQVSTHHHGHHGMQLSSSSGGHSSGGNLMGYGSGIPGSSVGAAGTPGSSGAGGFPASSVVTPGGSGSAGGGHHHHASTNGYFGAASAGSGGSSMAGHHTAHHQNPYASHPSAAAAYASYPNPFSQFPAYQSSAYDFMKRVPR